MVLCAFIEFGWVGNFALLICAWKILKVGCFQSHW